MWSFNTGADTHLSQWIVGYENRILVSLLSFEIAPDSKPLCETSMATKYPTLVYGRGWPTKMDRGAQHLTADSPVDLAPMSYADDQHQKNFPFHLIENSVVAHAQAVKLVFAFDLFDP